MILHLLSMAGLTIILLYLVAAYALTRDINIFVGVLIFALLLSLVCINLRTEMKKAK